MTSGLEAFTVGTKLVIEPLSSPIDKRSNSLTDSLMKVPPPLRVGEFEATRSIVLAFEIAIDPPTDSQADPNDSVHCEHYVGPLGSYMSFQRNRLDIKDFGATSRQDFVEKAMFHPSPFAEVSPIPLDIQRSINFLSSNTPDQIRSFWQRRLNNLRLLVSAREDRSRAWYLGEPEELSNFHRRYPLDVWATLMQFCGLGGESWLLQFAHGFPITGTLSRKFTFPLPTKRIPDPMSLSDVIASSSSRFRSRAARQTAATIRCIMERCTFASETGSVGPTAVALGGWFIRGCAGIPAE